MNTHPPTAPPNSGPTARDEHALIRVVFSIVTFVLATAVLVLGQLPDNTQPTVAITAPALDSGVSGIVIVQATASDNVGVAAVQFQIDLMDHGEEDVVAPFEVEWDTSAAASGAHTLSAVARDAAGNVRSSELMVVVVCGASVQPCPTPQPAPPANRAPVANGDALTSDGGAAVTFTATSLLLNDTDPDNQALALTNVAGTSTKGGTIVASGNGAWTYTPPAGFAGTDTFLYTISDGGMSASALVSVTVTAPPPPPPPPSALVAYFTFDDQDASRATDMSGRANHGLISGAVPVAGVNGSGLRFDGVNDWVTVADSASLDLTAALTIEAWVNPVSQSGDWRTIVMKERAGGLVYTLYAYDGAPLSGGTNRPAGYARLGGVDRAVRGPATLPLNTWTHLAMTYGGGALRFYVNGTQVASLAATANIAVSGQPLRIGGNAVWGEFFNGVIDEVRIYNRQLTGAEIAADMDGTVPPPPINRSPIAGNDTVSTTTDVVLTINEATLLAGDSDPDGDAIRVTRVDAISGAGGMVASSGTTGWTYTPPASFNGSDSFTYTIADPGGLTATGTVTVNVTAAPPPPPPPSPAEGLVLAMGFNEGVQTGSGSAVSDTSGNNNHGTVTGATFTSNSKFGLSALSFDGVNDWVTVADAATLDLRTGMTLEAWVNPSSTLSGWRTVLMKEIAGGLAYSLYANDNVPQPAGYVQIGGDQSVAGLGGLPLNTWTHLAVTYDGTALRFYVNGALARTRTLGGTIAISGRPLRIGGNAIWGEYFSGLIDEVRVYNRALSPAEIQADMQTPLP